MLPLFLLSFLLFSPLCWGDSPPCTSIPPQGSSSDNYNVIMNCLKNAGGANLTGGTYPISSGINMPAGSYLVGDVSKIVLEPSTNYVLHTNGNNYVYGITLDANNNLPEGCCSAVVSIGANGSSLKKVTMQGQWPSNTPGVPTATGVYLLDTTAKDNLFEDCTISTLFHAVISRGGMTKGSNNRFVGMNVFNIDCDAFSLGGYVEVSNSHVYQVGMDCQNGIPGAAFYSLGNTDGAFLQNNLAENTCGQCLDMDKSTNFQVIGNTFQGSGYTFNGKWPYCSGSQTATLMDCSYFSLQDNTIKASWSQANKLNDPNHVFGNNFEDLPFGDKTALNLLVAARPDGGVNVGNSFTNNTLISNVAGNLVNEGYGGVGYFASRNTGYDYNNGGKWTPSYYTGNNPFGSNVGSKRCGGNWYAGNNVCNQGSPYPCNEDDFQHQMDNWKNDPGCSTY